MWVMYLRLGHFDGVLASSSFPQAQSPKTETTRRKKEHDISALAFLVPQNLSPKDSSSANPSHFSLENFNQFIVGQ